MNGNLGRCVSLKYLRVLEDVLLLNGRNISFVYDEKYVGVIFNRKMARRLHKERTAAKALGAHIMT
jgi:hypothetical protein